jgi:hypothetical protein
MQMGDGRKWIIPTLHRCDGEWRIPDAFFLDDEGNVEVMPLPTHSRLRERVLVLWDYVLSSLQSGRGIATAISDAQAFEILADSLGVNYDVGYPEVSVLGLLDTARIGDYLGAVIDLPAITQKIRERTDGAELSLRLGLSDGQR